MKVLSQLLGRYSKHKKPLILFRLPNTDTLLYRLSDVAPLFKLPPISFEGDYFESCYKDHEDYYLNTNALFKVALHFNKYVLAELCKFQPDDYQKGLADAILETFPEFIRAPKEEHIWESVQLPLEKMVDRAEYEEETAIKIEPPSPPALNAVESKNVMALDKVLLSTNELRRQNMMEHANKRQKTSGSSPSRHGSEKSERENRPFLRQHGKKINSYATDVPEDQEELSNKKRLSAKHKNSLNLTIFAPSYHEQLAGARSAPINTKFNQAVLNHQVQYQKSNLGRVNHGLSFGSSRQNVLIAPATARPTLTHQSSPRKPEFAVPPIVPSQQQPPHSAHPASRESLMYQQYSSSSSHFNNKSHFNPAREHVASSAVTASLPPKTPTTSSFAALQRQQYLQPFEHLFDTIETTRTLKSTLDDQIRRSSSLMQTLQASATTIEGLVRNQVKEAQAEVVAQIQSKVDQLSQRIEALESRLEGNGRRASSQSSETSAHVLPSPLLSATREERAVAEDLVAMSEKRSEELQTPPTIVRSQNDIGPQEYQTMLTTLRDRLDRLERQIET
ncbi:hypothetical protein BY458DRAFT_523975 [Sporodiniella umbellata]|nr:hypothetical protein BY458DRAFT_523975 [Sporodiniella umbellata]